MNPDEKFVHELVMDVGLCEDPAGRVNRLYRVNIITANVRGQLKILEEMMRDNHVNPVYCDLLRNLVEKLTTVSEIESMLKKEKE